MAEFDSQNQRYRMVLAAEPLIDVMLQRGETDEAPEVVVALRARAMERVDSHYHASVLQLKVAIAEGDKAADDLAYLDIATSGRERTPPDTLLSEYTRHKWD